MDLSKLVKVRFKRNGDVQEFIPSVASRLVDSDQAEYFEDEHKHLETAATKKNQNTAARAASPLRNTR